MPSKTLISTIPNILKCVSRIIYYYFDNFFEQKSSSSLSRGSRGYDYGSSNSLQAVGQQSRNQHESPLIILAKRKLFKETQQLSLESEASTATSRPSTPVNGILNNSNHNLVVLSSATSKRSRQKTTTTTAKY